VNTKVLWQSLTLPPHFLVSGFFTVLPLVESDAMEETGRRKLQQSSPGLLSIPTVCFNDVDSSTLVNRYTMVTPLLVLG